MEEFKKIVISPFMESKFKEIRMPISIMDKYFEVDPKKPKEDYFETRVRTPWDGEKVE